MWYGEFGSIEYASWDHRRRGIPLNLLHLIGYNCRQIIHIPVPYARKYASTYIRCVISYVYDFKTSDRNTIPI